MDEFRIERYGDDDPQFVEVWDPAGEPDGTAVLVHGGYWRDRYGLDLMHPMARHLRARGWRVINIEYRRLRPGDSGVFDDMAADVLTAIDRASPSPSPAIAIGHSAGGQLALWAGSRSPRIDAVVALAPVADLIEADRLGLSNGAASLLLGGGADAVGERYREASPIELVPLGVPQYVVHGDADTDVPIELSTSYAARARAAGDDVVLSTPTGIDHFHVIDPTHPVWPPIDAWLDAQRGSGGVADP